MIGLALCVGATVVLADTGPYNRLRVVHTEAEGFQTTVQTIDGVQFFMVTNGDAQMVLRRPAGLAPPSMSYATANGLITLTIDFAAGTHGTGLGPVKRKAMSFFTASCSLACTPEVCGCDDSSVFAGGINELVVRTIGPTFD